MALHQQDENANQLWIYFKRVIEWVQTIFPAKRKEMKGLSWGLLYNQFKDATLDPDKLEAEIKALMIDDDVTNKKGIYPYVLTRDERNLNIAHLRKSRSGKPTSGRMGYALTAASILPLRKCRATISRRGARADIQPRITAKCAVRTATAGKAIHDCLHLFSVFFE